MTEYGLPSARDEDGELQPVDHEFEWDGETVTIKLYPPTIADVEEYDNFGEDMDMSEMAEVVNDHLVEPDIDEPSDMTINEALCYVEGIVDYAMNGTSEAVQDALEEGREDVEGN